MRNGVTEHVMKALGSRSRDVEAVIDVLRALFDQESLVRLLQPVWDEAWLDGYDEGYNTGEALDA